MIVLGAINIRNMDAVNNETQYGENCFQIYDQEQDEWDLCAEDHETQEKWYCKIREVLGDPCGQKPPEEPVEVKKEVVEDILIY